ncbi:O-linked N-acetylglucosamine transferase, SPINDLY family protein [Nostoc sp. CHAB 5824]|nr:O-linked N-acetylglucosamine transferase, SPINDLY family protein [Nostoc sp. CHAB 5824]
MIINITNWEQQVEQYLAQGNYVQAASLYEQAIAQEPDVASYYWHLGLLLLLQGQEVEAQMTWMLPMTEVEEEKLQDHTNELLKVLSTEAERREALAEYSLAWTIRQHMREINPSDIQNLLTIIQISLRLEQFEGTELSEWEVIEIFKFTNSEVLSTSFLQELLQTIIEKTPNYPVLLDLIEVCFSYISEPADYFFIVLPAVMKIAHTYKLPALAARILELYFRLDCQNIEVLRQLAIFHQDSGNYSQGIETAKLCYSQSEALPDRFFAVHLLLRGLMTAGGYWEEICLTCQELENILKIFIKSQPLELDEIRTLRLLTPAFAIPHIKDSPVEFRGIHNQIAQIFQSNIQAIAQKQSQKYSQRNIAINSVLISTQKLKIGYISYAFRQHSVGWLARWLLKHHNQDKFEIHTYFVNYKLADDFLQNWYVNHSLHPHKLGINGLEIAEKIYQDEIDILVDLDSITLDISSEVMALKPAPIQVTWLGWDASGIPAIDYFIADPYVLPDSAQDYYTEKIWRLPNTYIAVDGFEVGVPTLHRNELDIPSDAVVYLSAQRGYKRHPETTKWQMKIIKEVPNSYFLIKGGAEEGAIKQFFYKIAEEEGVECSRLRFLPQDPSEAIHRANLTIADVVLDTYPYNGATTTLETLWMGIPLVTRVGQQFAARNSYTMMMNAGITEGIAWTDEEYVEWGVRLGKDEAIRQQVVLKLKASRQTAPLWNGKQFTRDMEKAYQQMWQSYIEGK